MSVQNVVLGQLIERRGYGYELADRLRDWTAAFELSDAAIYTALRQLHRRGLVVPVGRVQNDAEDWQKAQRVIYEATDAGRDHFETWKASRPRKTPLREELFMQMVVAQDDDIPVLIENLRLMEAACRDDLARALSMSLGADSPHARMSPFGAPLVRDGLTSHLQAMIDWCQRSRRSLQNRQDGTTGVPGRNRP